VITKTAVLFYS